jgi:hypothetical protein
MISKLYWALTHLLQALERRSFDLVSWPSRRSAGSRTITSRPS